MGYVDRNLTTGEQVVYKAEIHWFIFVRGVTFFVLGMVLILAPKEVSDAQIQMWGAGFILIGILFPIEALIKKISTELVVTTKRVIAKVGLVSRSTIELNHSKVESFTVDQSVFGRLLGYGTLVVHGTGGSKTTIPSIDAPLEFRRNAMEMVDVSQSKLS